MHSCCVDVASVARLVCQHACPLEAVHHIENVACCAIMHQGTGVETNDHDVCVIIYAVVDVASVVRLVCQHTCPLEAVQATLEM